MKYSVKESASKAKSVASGILTLVKVVAALSVMGLGLYAVYLGKFEATVNIKQVALIVSGVITAGFGAYQAYRAVNKGE